MADVDSGEEEIRDSPTGASKSDSNSADQTVEEESGAGCNGSSNLDSNWTDDTEAEESDGAEESGGSPTGGSNSTDQTAVEENGADCTGSSIWYSNSADGTGAEESGCSPTGGSNSTDETAVEENGGGGTRISTSGSNSTEDTLAVITDGYQAAASSSTNQTQNFMSCNPDRLEKMSVLDFIFHLRRKLKLSDTISSDNGNIDAPTRPREPASRNLPPECLCFVKKLTLTDASPEDGRLDLALDMAIWIPTCPQIPKDVHEARRSVELMVFDFQNTQYNMVLTGYNYEGNVLYRIDGEWGKFISAHRLQQGDVIFFCKNRDARVNDGDFYYIILFTRRSDGDFAIIDEDEPGEDEREDEPSDE
ncbi:hypothetical protein F511_09970 [Dorcoceras hygrometricum]|uniref:Uncharacterized protein n=1 Tax=Dorcoceras hygrometricum TaxID=472368 RepID=A0A2Z7D3Z6_9LAMI|nr:hypothetical protein F511_09970 [Dorcoceras hygrometricum]